ncbi:MAG: PAS domain S-box protein, partial [Chloroflexi bacterium]|nr:PAS domain S-box protein [Chloroflexota bacterium]
MNWQQIIPIGINVVGIIVALGIFLYTWRRRMVPGAKYFGLYMLAAAVWAVSVVFWRLTGNVMAAGPLTLDGFWPLVGQVGILLMPAAWLAFALKYTGQDRWLKVYLWGPLAVVVMALFLLQLAHEAGVWVRVSHDLGDWGGNLRLLAPMGMAMLGMALEALYVTILLLLGGLLLVLDLVQSPRIYRGQYLTLIIGGLAPWVLGVPAILRLGPFFEEWVSLSFAIGGLIGAWGIARFRLFDVVPIALGAVVESLDDGVIVLDTRNRIVHLNAAAQRMIGRPIGELEGVPVAQALPDWVDLLGCLEQGCPQAETWLGTEAERRCYDLRASLLHGRRGALTGRLLLLRDITHRKRAEEAHKQSEARYRLLVENAPVGILSANRDGQVVDVNPQLLLILGSPSVEATRDINVLTYPPLVEAGVAAVARRCLAGVSLTSELPYTSAWGKQVHLRLHATPICDDDQITGFQAIVEDITERKQVEEALRASEERLKLAIEGAGLGLWDIDLTTGDAFIDTLGSHYLGFAPGERVSEQQVDDRLKQYVHVEDRDKLDQALNLHLAGEAPFWEVELRTPRVDKPGEWAWILLRGQVVARDGLGQPQRMAGITQDITRRKRAEEAMRESEERLKIAMEAADLSLWDMNLVTNETVVAHAKGDHAGWGYDQEVMTDERWAEWIHPEDLPQVLAARDRHLAGETPVYEVEFRARYEGGDWAWFLQRGKVVCWDDQDQPLRATGIQDDI